MVMLIGRVVINASIHTVKNERQVVNFDVAMNDSYKPKDGEVKNTTTFISCAYWISTKIAEVLKKGSIVEVNGRIYSDAYTSQDGKAKGVIRCQVNSIKVHQYVKEGSEIVQTAKKADDLPF